MTNFPTLGELGLKHDPKGRGYHVVYREHEVNHCPGCGRTHWYIGRVMAEWWTVHGLGTLVPAEDAPGKGIYRGRPTGER